MKANILAAGVGKRLGSQTGLLPKCLIPLGPGGPNLLKRYFDAFRRLDVRDVVVVAGHLKDSIEAECRRSGAGLSVRTLFNPDYRRGSILSLYTAEAELTGACLVMDADVYFPEEALEKLLRSSHANAFLADTRVTSSGEEQMLMAKNGRLVAISKTVDPRLDVIGESVGFLKLSADGAHALRGLCRQFVEAGRTGVEHEETYPALMRQIQIGYETMDGYFWSEMDFQEDLDRICRNLAGKNG